MDIQSEKLELIRMLLEIDDKAIIEAVKNILKSNKKEVWEKLTPEQQEEINIVIQKENRGDIVDF
jgi:hypothetical protein